MAEITLQNSWALPVLLLAWLFLVAFAWQRRFKPFIPFLLRLIIIVLIALALSDPVQLQPVALDGQPPPPRLVLLVDQSTSLGKAGQQALRAEAARLSRAYPTSITLFFADKPALILPLSPALTGNQDLTNKPAPEIEPDLESLPLDSEISNLADALSLGARLLDNQAGRLVLLSDGRPTRGESAEAVAQLARPGLPVDVLTLDKATLQIWAGGPNEIRLTKLEAPPVLRQGENFDIEVTIHSLTATDVTLRLTQTSQETGLAEDVISVEPGLNRFSFAAEAEEPGLRTFRAAIAAAGDAQPANNSLSTSAQVYPPPKVLVVGDDPAQLSRFSQQLEEAGFTSERIRPANLPNRLSDLEAYTGMALLNVSARTLELEQMITVQEFARSLGRGLLVTGGRDSFSLGHYADTPLADMLPVSLEAPPREERPPVALLLIIDHSGTMFQENESPTKMAMAKAAAIRATDILGPDDLLGVLIFDNRYEWAVPFQPVSDGVTLLEIQRSIATIPDGGGTRIFKALEVALPTLAEQETAGGGSHAVLFSDGESHDGTKGRADYDLVVDAALEANITLSTIAIGSSADRELMGYLAERGLGRYHFAATPDELPALTIAESDILHSNAVQEGEFQPSVFAPHPILRGLFPPSSTPEENPLPELSGYIAMTPKPRAEIALQIGPGDPLLSVWGYGLGRVAAWSSDTGHEWAANWYSSAQATRFWGQVLGYTLPAPDLGRLQLQAVVKPNGLATLTADSITAAGQTVDLVPTQATLTTPAKREISLSLRQVSPGRYQQQLRLSDPGAYLLSVTQTQPGHPDQTASLGFVVPYSAEYNLPEENTGQPLLKQIAAATGGRTFSLKEPLPSVDCDPQLQDCKKNNRQSKIQNPKSKIQLWPWLLGAALILWPIEIAWRRWSRMRIQ